MAEKHKHSRENACLSPRERPVSAIFPNALDPSQVKTRFAAVSSANAVLWRSGRFKAQLTLTGS